MAFGMPACGTRAAPSASLQGRPAATNLALDSPPVCRAAAAATAALPPPPAARRRSLSPSHSTLSVLSIQIVELAVCTGLTRLDLSKNKLTSLDGVAMNTALRWLSAAGNALTRAEALRDLEQLEVLNLGRNQLAGKVAVGRLRALKALIANDNQITLVGGECLAWPWQLQLRRLLALSAVV